MHWILSPMSFLLKCFAYSMSIKWRYYSSAKARHPKLGKTMKFWESGLMNFPRGILWSALYSLLLISVMDVVLLFMILIQQVGFTSTNWIKPNSSLTPEFTRLEALSSIMQESFTSERIEFLIASDFLTETVDILLEGSEPLCEGAKKPSLANDSLLSLSESLIDYAFSKVSFLSVPLLEWPTAGVST